MDGGEAGSSALLRDAVGFETARVRLPLPLAEFGPEASAVLDHATGLSIQRCSTFTGFRGPLFLFHLHQDFTSLTPTTSQPRGGFPRLPSSLRADGPG